LESHPTFKGLFDMIEISNLYKKYGQKLVLKDLNLSFNRTQVYGIMGANGAGKTTLFKCIAGLESYQGSIKTQLDPLKNHLGLLWTVPYFFSKITGREYIRLLCNARKIDFPNLEQKNIFDLPLDQYASNYSTGMKKKLALTAILLQENEVFIFDEPFNGVDIQSNMIIESVIQELKRLGKTILISSHIFSTLSANSDEIYLLKDGVIDQHVCKKDFAALETNWTDESVKNKISKLGLK
jgi:ABC-2 type transport system ATP-binding protein